MAAAQAPVIEYTHVPYPHSLPNCQPFAIFTPPTRFVNCADVKIVDNAKLDPATTNLPQWEANVKSKIMGFWVSALTTFTSCRSCIGSVQLCSC